MADLVRVINGLEHCIGNHVCDGCPYHNSDDLRCEKKLKTDALVLLKKNVVIPHKNYKHYNQYWCECGWFLGRVYGVQYCANCGGLVNWDGRYCESD